MKTDATCTHVENRRRNPRRWRVPAATATAGVGVLVALVSAQGVLAEIWRGVVALAALAPIDAVRLLSQLAG